MYFQINTPKAANSCSEETIELPTGKWGSQRLKWAGHLARMKEDRCFKKIFLAKPMGNRLQGRPPLRWIDSVEKDLHILKVKNWKTIGKSRDAWRKLLEKARAHMFEEMFSTEERIAIVSWKLDGKTYEKVYQLRQQRYAKEPSTRVNIRVLVNKFRRTGSMEDEKRPGRSSTSDDTVKRLPEFVLK
ncbi:hypothetical protein TNCV_4128561 [Trichonephila clavipes]|nr:hypothetical protein TNCV_4128561 [Trichonephila clavipes]